MKKIIGIAVKGLGSWFSKSDTNSKIVEGVEKVNDFRLDKKKVGVVIIAILALLLAFGKIDIATFKELFEIIE